MEDVKKMISAIRLASGNVGTPNKLVLGSQVYDALLENPQIVARIIYSAANGSGNPAMVTKNTLAQLFGVNEVLVSYAVQNVGAAGTESNAYIAGKSALLAYVPDTVGLRTPAAGFNFTWSAYGATRVTSYDWLPTRSTHIELEAAFAYNLVSADLGGYFGQVIA